MTKLFMTCRTCEGSGIANNTPAFYNEEETHQVTKACEICEGNGKLPVSNPIGMRAAHLVAKKIAEEHPEQNKDLICQSIETSVAIAISEHDHKIRLTIEDGDLLVSDDEFPEDKTILDFVQNHGILLSAKQILGL